MVDTPKQMKTFKWFFRDSWFLLWSLLKSTFFRWVVQLLGSKYLAGIPKWKDFGWFTSIVILDLWVPCEMKYVPPATGWEKKHRTPGINCFANPGIVSNRKINPTQHATGCWWWLLVFYYPRHMPQVFSSISRGSFSGILFQKSSHRIWLNFVSVENLNKGSKRVGLPSIIPGTYQWIIFCRRWNALIFGLAMVVLSRFPVRTGLWEGPGRGCLGIVWLRCCCWVPTLWRKQT